MLRALIIILPLALAVYALVDLVQTPDDDVQGLPKLAWVVLIVLIWVVGPVAWLIAGKRGPSLLSRLLPRPAGPGEVPGRQVAPDDDPDFLRGLRRSSPPSSPPPPPADPRAEDPRAEDLEEFERDLGEGDDGPDPDDPPLTSR